jgi:hypothetical protein
MAQRVAARARVDVGLPCGLVRGNDGVANRVGHLPDFAEVHAASGRDRALHRARVPERVPFAIERAGDAPFVTRVAEVAPPGVEDVGAARDLPDRLFERPGGVVAPLIGRRRDRG